MFAPKAIRLSLFATLFCSPAFAQLPATRLSSIFPAGAQAGQTVEVTITGEDLDDVNSLTFSHPGVTAKPKMSEPGPFDTGPQPVVNQFIVTVAANVPIGICEARAAGKYGTSNPRAFTIGDLAEVNEVEPNNSAADATEFSQPAVINGQSSAAGDVDYFKFNANAGQRVVILSAAQGIDSRLDTVVSVYDGQGRQVGSSHDGLAGDSLVDFVASAAGEYTVKIHDAAYQGAADFVYRLRVGVLPVIDFVFPPAGLVGGSRPFTVYGRNLPGGKPAGLTVEGRPLESLAVNIPIPGGAAAQGLNFNSLLRPSAAGLDATEYRVKGPLGSSNPFIIGIAATTPVVEIEPNDTAAQSQTLTAPCEVMGRFDKQRDRDWYRVELKQGDTMTVDVVSQRMGIHSHPSLLVERVSKPAEGEEPEQTQQLAYVFETANTDGGSEFDIRNDDPSFNFTATADGVYRLMVRDAYSDVDSDPRRVYRLTLNNGQPDFRLAAVGEGSHSSVLLRKGGQVAVRVVSFRRDGFDGEIEVSATNLPPGVTSTPSIIGPKSNHTMLVLTAAANANPVSGLIQIVGKSKLGAAVVTRTARFGAGLVKTTVRQNSNQIPPSVEGRITRNLAVSVSAEPALIVGFKAGDGKVIELPRGGKTKVPVARGGPFKGKINFVPRGLPANVNAPAGVVNANQTAGEFALDLRSNTPVGTYTFYLDAIAEQLDYSRNPEAAKAAAARKIEVDAIKTKVDADAKVAATAKAAADAAAAAATTALAAATQAKAASDQALGAAMNEATAATTKATQAKAAAAADKSPALATAATAAEKAATAAAAQVTTATANVAATLKTMTEGEAKLKTAMETKATADRKASETAELAKAAALLKTATDKRATDTTNAAKAKKVNVPIVSEPVTLKVTPAPITLAEPKAPSAVKQGQKLEVPVSIARLYDFKAQVNLQVVLPPGLAGTSIPNSTVPANQTVGKLLITAAANATDGEHQLTVRATMTLNGQTLIVEQPLRLVIEKVTPTK